MDRFELLGPLPREGTTTVLEASAGTGKTFALAGLVTRYLAETAATLDEMLLITFNRAASRELRERVRGQIVEAVGALQGDAPPSGELVEHLLRGSDAERAQKRSRLRDALANFDAATIATTHEFCGSVLKSLGVAGDNAADVELKESLTDLVTEIVDDRYLANFGRQETDPELTYAEALALALAVVDDPCAQLRPPRQQGSGAAALCRRGARGTRAPQGPAACARIQRSADPFGDSPRGGRLASSRSDAGTLADRAGGRVSRYRPHAVAGARARV